MSYLKEIKMPDFPGSQLSHTLKGFLRSIRIKKASKLIWFFYEKTMSSDFEALIPNPLGRYKYQTQQTHQAQQGQTTSIIKSIHF